MSTKRMDRTETDIIDSIERVSGILASQHINGWVSLTDLRRCLADTPRRDLDRALKTMFRARRIILSPEHDQKTLTDEDRAAAFRIGGEDKHKLHLSDED